MKETHEGIINLLVECDDPDDYEFRSSVDLEPELLKKHNLEPGDRIQYKIINDDIVILGKIHTKKHIEKIN